MNNELNNTMVTKVMGFLFANDLNSGDSYYLDNENGDWYCLCEDWHPDTDLNQAMMCAEKFRESGYYFTLSSLTQGGWQVIIGRAPRDEYPIIRVKNDKLELAICEAILEALDE